MRVYVGIDTGDQIVAEKKKRDFKPRGIRFKHMTQYMRRRHFFRRLGYVWVDLRNNIFKDTGDAVFGIVVMLAVPSISLFGTLFWSVVPNEGIFLSYIYPILALCAAGAYDTFGRLRERTREERRKKWFRQIKLWLRIAFDATALVVAVTVAATHAGYPKYLIPPVILIVLGIILLYDAIKMIQVTRWIKASYAECLFEDGEPSGGSK